GGKPGTGEAFKKDGGGGDIAGKARHRTGIGPSDANAQHVATVEANGPGIAVAVGSAGLVGYAAWRCALRGPHAAQYVGDLPIGRGVEDGSGCLRHRLSLGSVAQNLNLAAIGQSCIELDEIAQGDSGTAEADGKPRRLVDGQGRPDTNLVEAGHEPRRTDRVQYADCRYVQR